MAGLLTKLPERRGQLLTSLQQAASLCNPQMCSRLLMVLLPLLLLLPADQCSAQHSSWLLMVPASHSSACHSAEDSCCCCRLRQPTSAAHRRASAAARGFQRQQAGSHARLAAPFNEWQQDLQWAKQQQPQPQRQWKIPCEKQLLPCPGNSAINQCRQKTQCKAYQTGSGMDVRACIMCKGEAGTCPVALIPHLPQRPIGWVLLVAFLTLPSKRLLAPLRKQICGHAVSQC